MRTIICVHYDVNMFVQMQTERKSQCLNAHFANRSKAVEEYTKTIERHESAALASTSTSPSLLSDLAARPPHVKLGSMRHLRVNVPSNPESTGDEVVTGDGHGHGDVMVALWPFEQNVFRILKLKIFKGGDQRGSPRYSAQTRRLQGYQVVLCCGRR
jgi:hypothetical protein